jgi:anthranilate phosphoribosyltransferase
VLADLGSEHALVVHGSDGLDEITTTGPTTIGEARRVTGPGGPSNGPVRVEVRVFTVEPEELGVPRARPEDLVGGTPEDNAAALERVLAGEEGPLADITVLNAGAALYAGGAAASIVEGVERARTALASGAARERLEALRAFSAEVRRAATS